MGKTEKKKRKIEEQIKKMENDLLISLTKKTSDVREINIGEYQRKILDLKTQLKNM